jgi:type II secretory pathway pseudopilin PulG
MKLFSNNNACPHRSAASAFTLVEMMFSVGIYVGLFIGVMIAIQIFGLRVYTLAATKLTATADARKALNQIRDDIRQAKTLQVGTLLTVNDPTTFSAATGTNWAQGNALRIYSISNGVAPYNIYYLELNNPGGVSSNNLMAYQVTSNSIFTNKLTSYITNAIIFDVENCMGNVLTNSTPINHPVYGMTLQFYQWEYPIAFVGTGNAANEYNYYQLRTKACRRAID